jgi:hypothetical protein
MAAFRDGGSGFGPGGGGAPRGRHAARGAWGWRRGASAGFAAFGIGALAGCGCETDFRLMQGEIESSFEAEWRCCQRIAESDPWGGTACFDELRQRRRRLSEMLLEWLEACRNAERDVARDIGRAIRGILIAATCEGGPVRPLPDGRTVTAGLPFGELDAISLRWELPVPVHGGRTEGRLSGRSVPVRFGDREVPVFASGRIGLTLDPTGHAGTSVERFELDLTVGTGAGGGPGSPRASLRLARDERFPAKVTVRAGVERLGFLVEVIEGREPWPLPTRLWMEWPLVRQGGTLVVGGNAMRFWDLVPPDPGIADWNDDGRVDAADLAAFLATPDERRDLDLDGEATAKDHDRFLEAWTVRCERPRP